jgi:hypothetical protein
VRESHHDPTIERSQRVGSDPDRRVLSSTAERSFVTGPRTVFVVSEDNLVPHGSTSDLVYEEETQKRNL